MDRALVEQVRSRAGEACEYCLLPQAASIIRFPIDHVIARQHGGPTELENLAPCCGRCNRFKGPNLAGIDPYTGAMTRLYNPRRDRWRRHLEWQDALLVGRPDGVGGHQERDALAVSRALFDVFVTVDKNLSFQQNLGRSVLM